jgi:hypothetical protein
MSGEPLILKITVRVPGTQTNRMKFQCNITMEVSLVLYSRSSGGGGGGGVAITAST